MTSLLVLLALGAAAPADFAFGWELELPAGAEAAQVVIPPAAHGVSTDPALRDVAIFDGAGREVPAAPFTPPPAAAPETWVQLPTFAMERPAGTPALDVRLRVERAADSTIRRIDSEWLQQHGPREVDYLLDASQLDRPLAALRLRWERAAAGDRGRYAVEASSDLERWETLVPAATVVDLFRQGDALERREIPLPPSQRPYLRLVSLGADLPPLQVEARLAAAPAPEPLHRVEARLVSRGERDGHAYYVYEAPGFFDVREARLLEQGKRAVASVHVASEIDERWLPRGSFTLFSVVERGEDVRSEGLRLEPGPRARRFRVETRPPLPAPPVLELGVGQDRLVFLLQGAEHGEGPYVLAAGSGSHRRTDAPVEVAIEQLQRRLGAGWQPPEAAVGALRPLGGEAARAIPPAPVRWSTWLLWAVLVGGAGLVALLAVRLLRQETAPPQG